MSDPATEWAKAQIDRIEDLVRRGDRLVGMTNPCRGCGDTAYGARIKGLCKHCAKDTYEDKGE